MDGEAYLQRLIATFLHDLNEVAADPTARSMVASWKAGEAEAAGHALIAAGALDEKRCREILSGFKALLIDKGIIQEWSGSVSFEMEAEAVVGERVAGDVQARAIPEAWNVAIDPDASPDLLKVIPIVREAQVRGRDRVVLLSLEVWSDHFTVRYATDGRSTPVAEMVRSRAPRRLNLGHFAWEVTDDVGTRYRKGGGGGGGGRPWHLWTHDFYPSLAPEAEQLILVAHDFDTVEELLKTTVDLT